MATPRGTRKPTISNAKRKRIIELAEAGTGRNDIVREVGVAAGTVSKIVAAAGLNFDRSKTRDATEARKVDLAARRAEIQAVLLEDAMRLRAQIWQPHEYIDHGGKDFDEARWQQDEPTPADKLKLMQATSAALGRSLDLAKHDADAGDKPAVDAWLDAMTGGA